MHQTKSRYRRSCHRSLAASIALLLSSAALLSSAHAQTDYSTVEIIPHHVSGNVYYLQGAGGHIGLSVGPDGVLMIDDQFAPLTEKILAAIQALSPGEIRFLINTHVHGDHVGGNENIGRLGVPIVARDEVRLRMQTQYPGVALPVLTYSAEISLHLNGEEVRAIPVPPAHTDGDSFIYFRGSDVLHTGDVFRTGAYPIIDLNNGGSLHGTLDALGIAIGLLGPDTLVIPGHGNVSRRADMIAFRDMVLDITQRVGTMVESGMNYDQIAAANPTAAYDATHGDPERFLRAVYSELGGQ
jgi:cyclase